MPTPKPCALAAYARSTRMVIRGLNQLPLRARLR